MRDIVVPSPLYPFRLDQLNRFEYEGFEIENVFRRMDDARRDEVVGMWIEARALPDEASARARTDEVCFTLRELVTGRLVGVNTLYAESLAPGYPVYFKNRMFIRPDFRRSRLMITTTAATLCYGKLNLEGGEAVGIANINENRKLARPGMRRIFSDLGYQLAGQVNGQDVWLFRFSGVRFTDGAHCA